MSQSQHEDEENKKKARRQILSHEQEEEDRLRRAQASSPNAGLETSVDCDEKNDIIAAYNARFGGKPGHKPPEVDENGFLRLAFPNKGDAESFFSEEAEKGRRMVIVDANTQTVLGYSNGDGKLYHTDGSELQAGEAFQSSNVPYKDFVLPEPRTLGM